MLSATDIRSRRVPRAVVAAGLLVQCLVFVALGVSQGRPWWFLTCLAYALAAAMIQIALALVRPGALGFGDVTCSLLVGQAVGAFGLDAFLVWWLAMGAGGLVWIRCWTVWQTHMQTRDGDNPRRETRAAPFVPVIVGAGVIAALTPAIIAAAAASGTAP